MRIILFIMSFVLALVLFGQSAFPATEHSNVKVDDGDDVPVCLVHKEKMVAGTVPIRYGLVRMFMFDDNEEPERGKLVDEYVRLKKERFPETRRWRNGGCEPGFLNYATSTIDYYCETCRRLEDEWFAKHSTFIKRDRLP